MMSLVTLSTRQPAVLLAEDSEQDAELALRVLQRHDPRVVLLGIKMPRTDGHQVLRRIKTPANVDQFSETVRQVSACRPTVNETAGER